MAASIPQEYEGRGSSKNNSRRQILQDFWALQVWRRTKEKRVLRGRNAAKENKKEEIGNKSI